MAKLINIEGHPGLARDPVSGDIVNINKSDIDRARSRKHALKEKEKRFDQLENDVSEIKSLLMKLLEEKNG